MNASTFGMTNDVKFHNPTKFNDFLSIKIEIRVEFFFCGFNIKNYSINL